MARQRLPRVMDLPDYGKWAVNSEAVCAIMTMELPVLRDEVKTKCTDFEQYCWDSQEYGGPSYRSYIGLSTTGMVTLICVGVGRDNPAHALQTYPEVSER
jgi:hypothetical protein